MMAYTAKQIAQMAGISRTTFYKRLQAFEEQQKFTKATEGRLYGESEVQALASLLDFKITKPNTNGSENGSYSTVAT